MGNNRSLLGSNDDPDDKLADMKGASSANASLEKYKKMSEDERFTTVYNKVLGSGTIREKFQNSEELLKQFAYNLCSEIALKDSYLNSDWLESVKLYEEIQEVVPVTQPNASKRVSQALYNAVTPFKSREGGPSPTVSSNANILSFRSRENQLPETVDENEDQEELTTEQLQVVKTIQPKLKDNIRIKLLIAETATSTGKRKLREIISPFLSTIPTFPTLGMFHSALIIGPFKIEWNDSGICVPRKIISSAAILTADIDHITTLERLDEVISKLGEVIVRWNCTKTYKEISSDKVNTGNCQDFVDAVLESLGIRVKFTGPLSKFVNQLRSKGKANLAFEIDEEFQKEFGLKENSFKFRTHLELDEFASQILEKNKDFPNKYKSYWALLKSFDRAFWLKHLRYPNHYEFQPKHTHHHGDNAYLDCPFGDPTQSSFLGISN